MIPSERMLSHISPVHTVIWSEPPQVKGVSKTPHLEQGVLCLDLYTTPKRQPGRKA